MDRRSFLRYASLAAAGHFAGVRLLGEENTQAESRNYKAMVCIFLFGGNDSNNTVVPLNTAANGANGYAAYARVRGPLALAENTLLPLGAQADGNYGLHPSLPSLQALFDRGHAALLANVGTLNQPLTPAQYKSGQAAFPAGLFQAVPQQIEWQNARQTDTVKTGWGGRIADVLGPVYNPMGMIPMVTSVAGNAVFCDGAATSPWVIDASNVLMGLPMNRLRLATPLQTRFVVENTLASQLKLIAEIIQARQALGMQRQIFFAALNGFDTTKNQLKTQAELLALVDQALSLFSEATEEMGVAEQVTTFTMSEYSRSFQPNATGGSNAGWGGHHIVLGGAVEGGRIYGSYPELALGGPSDSGAEGQWLPTTALSQYGATLASWFGVPAAELNTIFPLLGNFESANLGFLA